MSVVLILGAGPNIGHHVSRYFSDKGYKTAIVSRTITDAVPKPADLLIQADLSDPTTVKSAFEECRKHLGVPNVIVYNAYAISMASDLYAVPLAEWTSILNINTVSPYAAAQEAVAGFRELPGDVLKTFIYTGNAAAHILSPIATTLTVGKVATANLIQNSAAAYEKEGFRFYYADERNKSAGPAFRDVSGKNHAEFYYKLATQKEQGLWEATFIGNEYVDLKGKVGELPEKLKA